MKYANGSRTLEPPSRPKNRLRVEMPSEVLEAFRADTDGVLSLALFRTFDGPQGDNLSSKENTAKFPPRLEISFRRGPPGTLIMFL